MEVLSATLAHLLRNANVRTSMASILDRASDDHPAQIEVEIKGEGKGRSEKVTIRKVEAA